MSRLIDDEKVKLMLSELLEVAQKEKFTLEDLIDHAYIWIDNIPTAYDIEKVVAELEEEKDIAYADFDKYVNAYELDLDSDYDDLFHKGIERAINVIRKGRV